MSLWRREQKKLNALDTVHQFIAFVHSGDDDLTKLTKLLHKNMISECIDKSKVNNTLLKYSTAKDFLNIFKVRHKCDDFSKNFKLKESKITCTDMTYTIVTTGKIIIYDSSLGFSKIMDFEETYVLTIESENNTIVRLENSYSKKFIKFLG